ncbi:MAG: MBL fold metallo-hydrolase [Verrucomicrobiales bacterium]|nr:MBL fold metallo-hydrolase [Verrucomicrobiales bacterium]MCP5556243.1 MBL fold metallo-hydrolase [Verrucomicrobiaceae bacterium]
MFSIAHFTGGIAQTNGYLFSQGDTHFVFDAPEGMAHWLEVQKVKVSALFLTHQHFDHVMDAAKIQTQHGCPTLAFAAYSQDLTLEKLYGMFTGTHLSIPPFSVDQVLTGKTEVTVDELRWELLHIPGHSPDSICFYRPEDGIVFGGDVLFLDGIGRTDFPGGGLQQLLQGIQTKLLTLPDTTRILPGHGPSTTVGRERQQNPMLDEF